MIYIILVTLIHALCLATGVGTKPGFGSSGCSLPAWRAAAMKFELCTARFLRGTRACLEDAGAWRQQLAMLEADLWAVDATSKVL